MPKIGLEIHGYILTNEKLFCSCKVIHGLKFSKPNTNICAICTGQPGSKPLLPNTEAVKKIIEIGLILNCKINQRLIWQRKHYNWPDLPKGYQNTISGTYAIPVGINGEFQGIRIKEVHLEEDPAAWNPLTGEIDYNRSGVPLVEIVTEPDFKDSKQVIEWLKKLLHVLSYIKAIDKSSGIKADVNISLPELKGERVEIKNINSLSNIHSAILHEIERQKKPGELAKVQETIIKIEKTRIEKLKSSLPENPEEKLKKLIKKYNIEKKSAEILTKKIDIIEFFEEIIDKVPSKLAVPWTTVELLRVLNYNKKELDNPEIDIKPEHFIELLKLVESKKITELKAKEILNKFVPSSFSPLKEAQSQGKITSDSEIEQFCKEAIKNNPKAVQDFKSGKQETLNFLIGDVMKLSNKRADYVLTRKILEKLMKK